MYVYGGHFPDYPRINVSTKSLTAVFINNINLLHPLVKQGIDIKNRLFYIQIRLMSMND